MGRRRHVGCAVRNKVLSNAFRSFKKKKKIVGFNLLIRGKLRDWLRRDSVAECTLALRENNMKD